MKKEMLRIQDVILQQNKSVVGPLFLEFYRGEITGIVAEDSYDKDILLDFFSCRSVVEKGYIYIKGHMVRNSENNKQLKKLMMEHVCVITKRSRLFDSLSLVDNICLSNYFIKTRKQKKIVQELLSYFNINIPVSAKTKDLTVLERIQVEIIHGVLNRRRLFVLAGIQSSLQFRERKLLENLLDRLAGRGYAVCQIEPMNMISLERMDRIIVLGKGKTIASFSRPEIKYDEISMLMRAAVRIPPKYDPIIKNEGKRKEILEFVDIYSEGLIDLSLKIYTGEILEINCKTRNDYDALKELFTGTKSIFRGAVKMQNGKRDVQKFRDNIDKWQMGCINLEKTDRVLFYNLSLLENICYPLCLKSTLFFLRKNYFDAVQKQVEQVMPEIDFCKDIKSLSQDEIARIMLCKWLLYNPRILVMFVPSSFTKEEPDPCIDRSLLKLSERGTAVIIISERYEFECDVVEAKYYLNKGKLVDLTGCVELKFD